jgi:uncharacterized protein YndB with AHSA1/START domain
MQTHDVVLSRTFDAEVAEVWKAWSEPAYVKRWWGPTGFTAPRADMDFREGGTSLVCMRAPAEFGGFDMYNTWTYSRIEPGKLIEFTLRFTDASGNPVDPPQPGVPAEVRHVITFETAGADRTTLTVTEYGYGSAQARDMSSAGMEQCLDKMAAIFRGGG